MVKGIRSSDPIIKLLKMVCGLFAGTRGGTKAAPTRKWTNVFGSDVDATYNEEHKAQGKHGTRL
jgi:hypothetical protein